MCGIVGCIGEENTRNILLQGLERLEYRGYDSAGIAVFLDGNVHIFKKKGRVANLKEAVDFGGKADIGIGHTRWATHGKPSEKNAHPHRSQNERFTLVHNGVVENYKELKEKYLKEYPFKSETDTEVVVALIQKFSEQGMKAGDAFRKAISEIVGSYAIVMMDAQDDDILYVAKKKSPLLIGEADGFNVVASDFKAVLNVTQRFIELKDGETVDVKKDSIQIYEEDGTKVSREPFFVEMKLEDIEKSPYPHFMLKEINEQPNVLRKIANHYKDEKGESSVPNEIAQAVLDSDRLYFIACGTSYHAGLVGKELLEKIAGIPTEVHVASEFAYNIPLLSANPLFVFISQSGETADSRAVLVKIKEQGFKALTITNEEGSTLSREADYTLLLHAGPEIAVASTKAYTAQVGVLFLLSCSVAKKREQTLPFDPKKELLEVADAMKHLCMENTRFEQIAKEYLSGSRNCFFIGRIMDYFACLEGALKLKEISYIQAEGYPGGELKHGPIALIEEGTPVFALVTQESTDLHTRGNVKEVEARGAKACVISMKGMNDEETDCYVLPKVNTLLTPLVSIVPFQFISYHAALQRGCDVDKPRNLAKSVTVE